MQNNWEPRVGQKVVALISGDKVKKGEVYEVAGTKKCKCGTIHVYLNHYRLPKGAFTTCIDCNESFKSPFRYTSLRSFRLAPLPEQYADMTSEIAKSFVEHPDKADQPVKVLETVN